jgi:hypothetical protein
MAPGAGGAGLTQRQRMRTDELCTRAAVADASELRLAGVLWAELDSTGLFLSERVPVMEQAFQTAPSEFRFAG